MQADKNYCKILKVDKKATPEQIRKSYRNLVGRRHPAVSDVPDAVKIFQELQEAYEVLGNLAQRRAYDGLRDTLGFDKPSAVTLQTIISHESLLTNVAKQALYVSLDITPASDLPTSRLPLNLCFVLDRSASMQGVRLRHVMEKKMDDKKIILIVDDEPGARYVLQTLLVQDGHKILSARNGQEALAQVEKLAPDVILLDIMMPDINGFEVCRLLKADERWQHIPIILVTALPAREDMVKGFEAGADDFLSKPFDNTELCARVRSMLRIKEQYDLLEKQRRELETTLYLREELARVTAQRLEGLEVLHEVGLNLMNSLDAGYMMELIAQTTFKLISQTGHCVMYFLSDDEERLVPAVFSREDGVRPIVPNPDNEDIIKQAMDIKETVYIPDLLADSDFAHLDLGKMRAILVIPLIVDNRAMGALSIDSLDPDAFEVGNRRVLSILATQLAVSIMKARLFAELARS